MTARHIPDLTEKRMLVFSLSQLQKLMRQQKRAALFWVKVSQGEMVLCFQDNWMTVL
ncbi:hypothetical protein [Acetobacter okinawensis]|uniref:hypothetical protein n=1 Tax=Acetobacter okinawensis TaxID=1076594 RepID=UPI000AA7EF4E|nr:hypothetical protein [Acetobacter okinawensis]MBS0966621.1 hypothetical protein [Acetobacter okinawensis]MBS0988240.1 hypothetical protein [Acetobacter okinawensis]MCP1214227.1 hypothetical protein [Acetobacter okinawensis]